MKKHSIILVFVLIALVVLPANAQTSPLTIWLTGGEERAQAAQEAAAAFTAETGIEVSVEAVSWEDAYARYLTSVNSGVGADMFIGGMSWGISLGSIGGLVELSTEFPEQVQTVLDGNNPAFVNAIVKADGTVYGVPFNQDPVVLYYMPENLAAVGFDGPPATWEEFTEAIVALEDAGYGGAAFGWGNADWIGFQSFLAQAGGSWYEEDCSAAAINSDEGLTALEYFTSLYDDYNFPREQVDPGAAFSTGEKSMVISGEWHTLGMDTSYPELEGKWTIAPLPAGPANNAAFIGGSMIGIFSYSENVDAAWQFIEWLQTQGAGQALTESHQTISALFVPPQISNVELITASDDVRDAILSQLEITTAPPNCAGWEEGNSETNLILQSVLFEGMDFEDALFELEDLLNYGLEAYGGY